MVPNYSASHIQADLENQTTLIIRTLMFSPKVSIKHSFHCNIIVMHIGTYIYIYIYIYITYIHTYNYIIVYV